MKRAHLCSDCAGTVQRLPRNAGRGMIWLYRHTLSPLVGYNCRHLPTCSVYADEAIERYFTRKLVLAALLIVPMLAVLLTW